jgi:hypothetical protein
MAADRSRLPGRLKSMIWREAFAGCHRISGAQAGFSILGETASPCVPKLEKILAARAALVSDSSSPNGDVGNVLLALQGCGSNGMRSVVSAIMNQSFSYRVRQTAIMMLGNDYPKVVPPDLRPAIPTLVYVQRDPLLGGTAYTALLRIVPEAVRALRHPDRQVRVEATNALLKIALLTNGVSGK